MNETHTGTISFGIYILLAVACFSSIDGSQFWEPFGDDFGLYISHARNLAQGRRYTDTKFVFNPADPWYSPRAYPPGFPLFLEPIYALRGIDFRAFKFVVTGSFLLSLPLVVFLLAPRFGRDVSLTTAALYALCPMVWEFQRYILPDFSYLFLSLLALLVLDRRARNNKEISFGVLAGLLIYAAFATRILGLALLLGALCYDLIHPSRSIRRTGVLLTSFLAAWGIQRLLLGDLRMYETQTASGLPSIRMWNTPHSGYGYTSQPFGICVGCIPRNLYNYLRHLPDFAPLPYKTAAYASIVFVLAAIVGFIHYRRRKMSANSYSDGWPARGLLQSLSVFDIYGVIYLTILLLMQFSLGRYLLPVLPFIFVYAVVGTAALSERFSLNRRFACLTVLLAGIALYGASYLHASSAGPNKRLDINGPEARQVFAFIRNNTPEDSLIAFEKPRALGLLTDRSSTLRNNAAGPLDRDLEDFLRRNVSYVLLIKENIPLLFAASDTRRAFDGVYASGPFQLLKFNPHAAREVLASHGPGRDIDNRR